MDSDPEESIYLGQTERFILGKMNSSKRSHEENAASCVDFGVDGIEVQVSRSASRMKRGKEKTLSGERIGGKRVLRTVKAAEPRISSESYVV